MKEIIENQKRIPERKISAAVLILLKFLRIESTGVTREYACLIVLVGSRETL